MYIEFQVKIFVLYNITNRRDVNVMSLNYEKIKKEFDDYNGQIYKIKGQEKLHKPTLDEMIKNGWNVEFVDNFTDCNIISMMYILKKETDNSLPIF